MTKKKIDPEVMKMLVESEVPFLLEAGGLHTKLKIDGHLVAVFPRTGRGAANGRTGKNARAAVRRFLDGRKR